MAVLPQSVYKSEQFLLTILFKDILFKVYFKLEYFLYIVIYKARTLLFQILYTCGSDLAVFGYETDYLNSLARSPGTAKFRRNSVRFVPIEVV